MLPVAELLFLIPLLRLVSRPRRSDWLGERVRPLPGRSGLTFGMAHIIPLRLRRSLRLPDPGRCLRHASSAT
jgi:hypothetical protein